MARILVTGGSGYIGSHLVDALSLTKQHNITSFDLYPRPYAPTPEDITFIQGNLNNAALIRRTIIDRGIEIVYHTAWMSIHETSIKDPVIDIERNLIPMTRLLEACREGKVKRVVFLSSGGTVYGVPNNLPVREDHPTHPISAYGITKLAAEKYLQMYAHLYGLEYVIFRPSVPYGPRQNPRRRQGAVSVFVYRALRNMPITIWGAGKILRDYFYISDLTNALVMATENSTISNTIINLAGAKAYSLNELTDVIQETLGVSIDVQYQSGRKFDVPQLWLNIDAATENLGWQPKVTLPEGIRKTAAWIQKWVGE